MSANVDIANQEISKEVEWLVFLPHSERWRLKSPVFPFENLKFRLWLYADQLCPEWIRVQFDMQGPFDVSSFRIIQWQVQVKYNDKIMVKWTDNREIPVVEEHSDWRVVDKLKIFDRSKLPSGEEATDGQLTLSIRVSEMQLPTTSELLRQTETSNQKKIVLQDDCNILTSDIDTLSSDSDRMERKRSLHENLFIANDEESTPKRKSLSPLKTTPTIIDLTELEVDDDGDDDNEIQSLFSQQSSFKVLEEVNETTSSSQDRDKGLNVSVKAENQQLIKILHKMEALEDKLRKMEKTSNPTNAVKAVAINHSNLIPLAKDSDILEVKPLKRRREKETDDTDLSTPALLCNYLVENGVHEEAAEILKDEGLTGLTLLDVTEEDLKELHIKLGPRKRIMQLMNLMRKKQEEEVLQLPKESPVKLTIVPKRCAEDSTSQKQPTVSPVSQLPKETPVKLTITPNRSVEASTSQRQPTVSPVVQLRRLPQDILNRLLPKNYADDSAYEKLSNVIEHFADEVVNIREWVESHPKGRELIRKLDSEIYGTDDRKLLVRIVCTKLVEIQGNAYPSSYFKEKIAKEIVKTFPFLKSPKGAGHEMFFDIKTGTGFINYRLKSLRTKLPSCEKRNRGRKERLKLRQEAIKESNTFEGNSFFEDYNQETIDAKFLDLYPDGNKFLTRFSSYFSPRILFYVSTKKPSLLQYVNKYDDDLKSLFLLPELLPAVNYNKVKKLDKKEKPFFTSYGKQIPSPFLIQYVNALEDLPQDSDNESIHPYLICANESSMTECQYYVKLDNLLISAEENPMRAFDLLFKFHIVLNISFAHRLENFYNFISSCVYEIDEPRAGSNALNTILVNIPMEIK